MSKLINCPACGNGLEIKSLKGRTLPWKQFPYIDLSEEFSTQSCSNCGEIFLKSTEATKLDVALENSVRNQTALFLQNIKENSALNQRALAKKLGLTDVYLSELISKKKTPSYQFFNLLKLVSNNRAALKELDSFKGKTSSHSQTAVVMTVVKKFRHIKESEVETISSDTSFVNPLSSLSRSLH